MYYAGIDYHKRYSPVSIQDDTVAIMLERRIDHNDPLAFSHVVQALPGCVKVVYECGLNWSWLCEVLEQIEVVESITVANPCKVRLMAEARIRTDNIDAHRRRTAPRPELDAMANP